MGIQVYPNANEAAAKHVDTRRAVRRENRMVMGRARANLAAQNQHQRITPKGYFPAFIDGADDGVDSLTILFAPNAVALEFGHSPSGFFGGTDTKPPEPTYILTRAALGGHTM